MSRREIPGKFGGNWLRRELIREIGSTGELIPIPRDWGIEQGNLEEIENQTVVRGTKLEYVHFQPTPKKFRQVKPTVKSTLVGTISKTMIDGIVYKITDSAESFVYIGSTKNTLQQRLEEHRKNPTNSRMAAVIGNPDITIEELETIRCTDMAALLRLEDVHIAAFMANPETSGKVLNVKLPKVHVPMKVTIVQDAPAVKEKFQIRHDPVKRTLTIGGTVPAAPGSESKTRRIQKKWVYPVDGYDAVKALADEHRAYLVKTYIG